MRDLCNAVGARIEYVQVPEGARFVFHRSDAFTHSMADNWPTMADKLPTKFRSGSEELLGSLTEVERETYAFMSEHGASRTAEAAEALGWLRAAR